MCVKPADTTSSCCSWWTLRHKKGFSKAPLVIKCWKFSRRKEAKKKCRMKINKFSTISKQFSRWKFICISSLSRLLFLFRFSRLFHFDCAKTETPFPFCLLACMAKKIYSETFITSKNPTEWSFTWKAFNNNPFSSSVFAPLVRLGNFLKISLSTDKIFIYGPRLYFLLICDVVPEKHL